MRILLSICLVSLISGVAWSQETMTPEQFRELAVTPGDTNVLRPELASLPFWRNAKSSVSLEYEDGRVFREECALTAKTVGGNYIVFSGDSQFYGRPIHTIVGYDAKASAIRKWSLFGDTLIESTTVFDSVKRIYASTATFAGGFTEISVGSCSDEEISERTLAYKDGVLFMTREVKTRPATAERKVEQDGPASGSQPIRSETDRPSSAAASRR